jgi:predicted TIM-barrel fold metal-dependent hydrolase
MSSIFCSETSRIQAVEAIDIHAHYGTFGPARICETAIPEEFKSPSYQQLHDVTWRSFSAGPETVCQRAAACNVRWSVVSPVGGMIPRGRWGEGGADTFAANAECARVVVEHPGLLQWVVVNPFQPSTYAQAAAMLQTERCAGIKLHPEEHCYRIKDRGEELFKFAAQHAALVMCHSGHRNSVPEDYVPFADAHPGLNVILAHLGNSGDIGTGDPTHHARAINLSRHGNVYADTSSAATVGSGILEYSVERCGADRILFGSDTPCYFTGMQRARIDYAEVPDTAKVAIRAANSGGPAGGLTGRDPFAPRRRPLRSYPDRESPIGNAPALVPGPVARL